MSAVVRPVPGDGVVAHQGGLLLVCGPAPDDTIDALLDAVQQVAAGRGNGRTLARRVARVLAEAMSAEPVSCAVAGPADGGVAVLVSGAATAVVTGPGGAVTLTGRSALTWTDRLIGGPVIGVDLRLGDPGGEEGPAAHPRWRLDGGVVPGGGVECRWAQAAPAEPPPPAGETAPAHPPADQPTRPPADQPERAAPPATLVEDDPTSVSVSAFTGREQPPVPYDDRNRDRDRDRGPQPGRSDDIRSQPFESVLLLPLTEPDVRPDAETAPQPAPQPAPRPAPRPEVPAPPQPDPRPLVWGGDCKNGHFNDPRAPYCGVCGIGMAQRTLIPRQGPRPPLGVLLVDDGMALRLDADYLLGRDPEHAKEVMSGQARPSRLSDDEGSVSRRHVRISLEQWDVRLVDLGSVNGTYVMPPGEETFVQIPPHEPVMIVPGTKVRVGGLRTFRYESHRK